MRLNDKIKIGDDMSDDTETNIKVFMAETVIYRKEQGRRLDEIVEKMDILFNKVSDLPCKERVGSSIAIANQIKALWVFVSAIVLAIISDGVKHLHGR